MCPGKCDRAYFQHGWAVCRLKGSACLVSRGFNCCLAVVGGYLAAKCTFQNTETPQGSCIQSAITTGPIGNACTLLLKGYAGMHSSVGGAATHVFSVGWAVVFPTCMHASAAMNFFRCSPVVLWPFKLSVGRGSHVLHVMAERDPRWNTDTYLYSVQVAVRGRDVLE